MENLQPLIDAIGSIGVPAAMCLYCLTTLNKTVDRMATSLDRLDTRIDTLMQLMTSDINAPRRGGKHEAA